MKKVTFILILALSVSCEKETCGNLSPLAWLESLIYVGKDKYGTLESVHSYKYNNIEVYLVKYSVECCDNFSAQLFDAQGKSLCFPYGGITGKGDLKCQEFDNLKLEEKLYWKK